MTVAPDLRIIMEMACAQSSRGSDIWNEKWHLKRADAQWSIRRHRMEQSWVDPVPETFEPTGCAALYCGQDGWFSVLICGCGLTDDNLWRPTRRAEGHYTKDKLSTRRGAVHSIGWLCQLPTAPPTSHPEAGTRQRPHSAAANTKKGKGRG